MCKGWIHQCNTILFSSKFTVRSVQQIITQQQESAVVVILLLNIVSAVAVILLLLFLLLLFHIYYCLVGSNRQNQHASVRSAPPTSPLQCDTQQYCCHLLQNIDLPLHCCCKSLQKKYTPN